jgi:hypothetical protein
LEWNRKQEAGTIKSFPRKTDQNPEAKKHIINIKEIKFVQRNIIVSVRKIESVKYRHE